MINVSEHDGTVVVSVRVLPRASRNAMEGEWQGALKVRLSAPPVDDKANQALCKFLAEQLNIPRSAVRILAGERGRLKRVEIRGVSVEQIRCLAKEGADH